MKNTAIQIQPPVSMPEKKSVHFVSGFLAHVAEIDRHCQYKPNNPRYGIHITILIKSSGKILLKDMPKCQDKTITWSFSSSIHLSFYGLRKAKPVAL